MTEAENDCGFASKRVFDTRARINTDRPDKRAKAADDTATYRYAMLARRNR